MAYKPLKTNGKNGRLIVGTTCLLIGKHFQYCEIFYFCSSFLNFEIFFIFYTFENKRKKHSIQEDHVSSGSTLQYVESKINFMALILSKNHIYMHAELFYQLSTKAFQN